MTLCKTAWSARSGEPKRSTIRTHGGWLRSILLHLYRYGARPAQSERIDLTLVDNDLALSVPPADRGATIDFIRAINGLSAEHRQILLLVGLEGLNYREIAEELGIPMGTVMSRLARARERLRNALDREQNLSSAEQQPSERRLER
jgi:RNA polymerase sigma-70 factor (ECF subfamily)